MGREALAHASRDELIEQVLAANAARQTLQARLEELEAQLRWFKQQLFGAKSERRLPTDPDPAQLALGQRLVEPAETAERPEAATTVRAHVRRPRPSRDEDQEPGLRFDDSVPVERIVVADPATAGLVEGVDYTVVSEKKSYRPAQQPASYRVLEIVRPVVKLAATGALTAPAAPPEVLPGSYADVSLLAGMLVDKLRYHLPLYRQHQRMAAAGITVSRAALTSWVHRTGELLEPIYAAQLGSILESQVIAMDETPIRAGRQHGRPGKMKTGYFWPLYGDRHEVAFPFAPTRAHAQVEALLGEFRGTLVSDGYEAYARFEARHAEVVHALCWAHARRQFVKAEGVEPVRTARALGEIRALYEVEREIQERGLGGAAKLELRATKSKPLAEAFFARLEHELAAHALLPSNPFTQAAHYALARRRGLQVFLADPDVPIDTNHLERALRPISMGRKSWLFCWTELGAERVGQIQSLITTCALHGVDPYTYLVDVLQRIDTHPFSAVDQLTPRLWKQHFAATPLRSLLDSG